MGLDVLTCKVRVIVGAGVAFSQMTCARMAASCGAFFAFVQPLVGPGPFVVETVAAHAEKGLGDS